MDMKEWAKNPPGSYILIGAGAVVVVAALYFLLSSGPGKAVIPEAPKPGQGKGSLVLKVVDSAEKPLPQVQIVLKWPREEGYLDRKDIVGVTDASGVYRGQNIDSGFLTAQAVDSRNWIGGATVEIWPGKESTATLKLRKK